MKQITAGAGVLNQTPFGWDENLENIRGCIALAREAGVGILCLPELCITGYGCEDIFHSSHLHETAARMLLEVEPESRGMVVSVGLPVFAHGGLYNAAALLVDGRLAGMVAKQ